jgi:hypothetical protein
MAKLPPDAAARASAGEPPPALRLQSLDVSEGTDNSEVLLSANFGATVLPIAVDRNLLAKSLTDFLQILKKLEA